MSNIYDPREPRGGRGPLLPGEFPREFQRHDPAFGRGYRIGNKNTVPANTPQANPVGLINFGKPDVVGRFKITLNVQDPTSAEPANTGAGLRFQIIAQMENDKIPRTCFVSVGGGQVLYVPGRSLNVVAWNPYAIGLEAHWNIDEVVAGISVWEDVDLFVDSTALTVEAALDLPTFCTGFEVFTISGGPAPTIRGYSNTQQVFRETVTAGRSGRIPVVPGFDYTIEPGVNPQNVAVVYTCQG